MAEDSWPSPSHNARAVTEPEYEELVAPYAGDGILGAPGDTSVVFGDSSGRQIKVRANKLGVVRGFYWTSGASETIVPITANSSGSTRTDLVVLRLDRSTWNVRLVVKPGSPGIPSLTRTIGSTGMYEIPIAAVTVPNGAVTTTAGQVVAREVYLPKAPILTTAANLANYSGLHKGQEAIVYNATSNTSYRAYWNGTTWVAYNSGPMAELVATSAQLIATAVATAVLFDSEIVDTHAGHSTVTNTSRYTCQAAGWYQISGGVNFGASGTGRRTANWAVNGTAVEGSQGGIPGSADGPVSPQPHTICQLLAVGDYVELIVAQNSGGGLNLSTVSAERARMSIRAVSLTG